MANENRVYRITPGEGEKRLAVDTVAMPTADRGQVVIRMKAYSLNFRDVLMVDGNYPVGNPGKVVPLSDGAGEVVALGEGCLRFAVGDRVCPIFMQSWIGGRMTDADAESALGGAIDGVLADYVVLDESGLVKMPARMTFAQAATLPCAAVTAWNALFANQPVKPGQTVLTLGTGGVAIWTTQLARAAGAEVIITSSSDEKLEKAKNFGAHHGVNYAQHENWGETVRDLTSGDGVDKVVDSAGPGAMQQYLACLKRGGEAVMVGVLQPDEVDPMPILVGGLSVRGIMVGSRQHFEELVAAVNVNAIEPVIDRRFAFEEAAAAFAYLKSASHIGKVVIENDNAASTCRA